MQVWKKSSHSYFYNKQGLVLLSLISVILKIYLAKKESVWFLWKEMASGPFIKFAVKRFRELFSKISKS